MSRDSRSWAKASQRWSGQGLTTSSVPWSPVKPMRVRSIKWTTEGSPLGASNTGMVTGTGSAPRRRLRLSRLW